MDQAEKVILEAEDQVSPSVATANAGLEKFEKQAEASHTKVIRVTDQTRTAVQRLIAQMDKQAETFSRSGVEKMVATRDQLLQRYAKEPAAIDAITKSYDKMIAAQRKVETEAKFEGFGEKVKQFIENPLKSAGSMLSSTVSSMGPWGIAIAGGAAALGAMATAGYEATKSLAEYGLHVKDVELRTGMTVKQVGEFSFAAKAVGQDISIVERMMRGLSQAESDNSREGAKAKDTLKAMGVDLRDSTGQMKPTAEALQDIAEGLAKIPAGAERDAAALNIFKRAGIEAIPMMEELVENIKRFDALGGGGSQADIDRWTKYNAKIAEADTLWDRVSRKVNEGIAGTLWIDIKMGAAKMALDTPKVLAWLMGSEPEPGTEAPSTRPNQHQSPADVAARGQQFAANAAKKAYQASLGPTGQLKEAESAIGRMVKPDDATTAQQVADYAAAEKQIEVLKSQIESTKHQSQEAKAELKEYERALAAFEKKGDEAELDAAGKIYRVRDELLQQAVHLKKSEEELARIRKDADDQVSDMNAKAEALRRGKVHDTFMKSFSDTVGSTVNKEDTSDWKAGQAAQERITDIGLQSQRAELQRRASRAGRMAELGGGSDEEIAQQTYQTRVNLALQLAGIEADRIGKETDANKKAVMAAEAQRDLFKGLSEAQDQFDEKQLQMQQKREQELQKQIDGLQSQAEKLFEVLFTKPKNFGKELASTIHAAVLKPVIETVSSGAASLLHPLIYGQDGNGGINGLFHPNKDPMIAATDRHIAATNQNSATMAILTAILAAGMGMAAPSMPGGPAGAPTISMPSFTMPSASFGSGGGISFSGGSFDPLGILSSSGSGGGGWSGGAGNIATPPFFGGGSSRAGGGSFNLTDMLRGLRLGGGDTSPSSPSGGGEMDELDSLMHLPKRSNPFSGTLASLKSTFSKGNWFNSDVATGAGGGIKGDLAGALSSKGAAQVETGVGMPLAMAGITGSRMGTWGGVGEATAGGALTGAGIGTMIAPGIGTAIGAGIGAAAGFGISTAEMALGMISPAQKVHDDVKSIYGIDLPVNSGTVKQIVSLAQSQYGGNIAVAVRSPSVRQLVMLYSEATNQKMPLSASTPYAGSLVQQGGSLYQQATYQDGNAHTYASNIPTLGGIASTGYPTQAGPNTSYGGGVNFAVNINGTPISPEFVADSSMAAQNSSYGRTQQAANMQVPGLMVS